MLHKKYEIMSDKTRIVLTENKQNSIVVKNDAVPDYLEKTYWWAYEHPLAVKFWDRGFLINFILLGNYSRLVNAALSEFPCPLNGKTLQISCAYGQLTPRLQKQLGDDARLDIVDILEIQLTNTAGKLMQPDKRIRFIRDDATALNFQDEEYDRALMFFLPHELPGNERRKAFAEALRVVKKGGEIVFVDFHKPKWWHPLRFYQRLVFLLFEPFATDMWRNQLSDYLPSDIACKVESKETYFGDFYQKVVVRKL